MVLELDWATINMLFCCWYHIFIYNAHARPIYDVAITTGHTKPMGNGWWHPNWRHVATYDGKLYISSNIKTLHFIEYNNTYIIQVFIFYCPSVSIPVSFVELAAVFFSNFWNHTYHCTGNRTKSGYVDNADLKWSNMDPVQIRTGSATETFFALYCIYKCPNIDTSDNG